MRFEKNIDIDVDLMHSLNEFIYKLTLITQSKTITF